MRELYSSNRPAVQIPTATSLAPKEPPKTQHIHAAIGPSARSSFPSRFRAGPASVRGAPRAVPAYLPCSQNTQNRLQEGAVS